MSAGLPGLGLGGLFIMLSALGGPLFELVRTLRGRSSRARWMAVVRQFVLAAAMIASIDATLRLLLVVISIPTASSVIVFPLAPIAMTAGVLTLLLGAAKGVQMAAVYARRSPTNSSGA